MARYIEALGFIPVKGTSQDEVVVDIELVQTFGKVPLEYQTTGLVDDYECVYDPLTVSIEMWLFM